MILMPDPFLIIAVDGGAASGKSSTSRQVAAALNLLHVDTGAHYRAVTFAGLQARVDTNQPDALESFLGRLSLSTRIEDKEARILLNGTAPEESNIRSPEVNAAVSRFAAVPAVREAVKSYQRDQVEVAKVAGFDGLIMDGRDIGTVIFPDATLKIFLTADEATRAARRAEEGQTDAIAERDRMDARRTTAPLMAAADAVTIDNSSLTLEEVVAEVIRLAKKHS